MKISDLVAQLQFLEAHYGDLECVLSIGPELRSMRHLKVDRLAKDAAASVPGVGAGERVSIISAGDMRPGSGVAVVTRSVAVRRAPAAASVSH